MKTWSPSHREEIISALWFIVGDKAMSTQPTGEKATPTASELLAIAAKTLGERGADYDPTKAAGERSMPAVVAIFKELSGKEITEQEGWLFMVALKLARIKTSPAKLDSHVDLIAYVSLYSESVLASQP